MKKSSLFLLLFLIGCHTNETVEALPVKDHPSIAALPPVQKTPVLWHVTLKDDWNDESYPIVMNDYGYFHDDEYDVEALHDLAKELAAGIDSPMYPAKRGEDGKIIPGKERVVLSEKELVGQIQSLPVGTSELLLPVYVTKPNVAPEDLEGIDELEIGSFITYFNPNVSGRAHNILLSAEEITNVIIGPGDSFSFNQVVGERTAERGYKEALEIVNKEFVTGIGGGICQTSSTLFNAVEQAGVEMTERFTHSRNVGYVPEGRDATVSWEGPDFCFMNTHSFPILIRSHVDLNLGEIRITIHTHNH